MSENLYNTARAHDLYIFFRRSNKTLKFRTTRDKMKNDAYVLDFVRSEKFIGFDLGFTRYCVFFIIIFLSDLSTP